VRVKPTVKVWSPEKTVLERAEGFKPPAGNNVIGAKASRSRPPGIEGRTEPDNENRQ